MMFSFIGRGKFEIVISHMHLGKLRGSSRGFIERVSSFLAVTCQTTTPPRLSYKMLWLFFIILFSLKFFIYY